MMEPTKLKIKTNSFDAVNDVIQRHIDVLFEARFNEKPRKKFCCIVSLEGKNSENMYLTFINGDMKFSERIFPPKSDSYYGLENLDETIERLFNRTI